MALDHFTNRGVESVRESVRAFQRLCLLQIKTTKAATPHKEADTRCIVGMAVGGGVELRTEPSKQLVLSVFDWSLKLVAT